MRKQQQNLKKIVISLVLLFLILLPTTVVNADSTPLSVKAILPDNQFNKEVSYYHLMMEPGAKQDIDVQLFNSSDKEMTALVTLTAATTNDNGLLDYNLPDKKFDKSLLHPFPEIASTPKEVKVPANQDVMTKISIEMPSEEYSGIILGGINIMAKKEEEKNDKEKKSGGMKIENEMNYALGVVLVENEELVPTDMKFMKVYASQIMGNNTTKVTLQNPTMAVMENVSFKAEIYAEGTDTVLYGVEKEGYRMAPNSNFDFGIPIGQERYRAGKYRLKMIATTDPKNPEDGEKQTWEFDQPFEIKREEADKLNASAVDIPKDYTMYYIIGAVLAIVLILVLILVVITRKKKAEAAKRAKRRKGSSKKTTKKSSKRS